MTVSLYGHNGGRRVSASSAPRQPRPDGWLSVVVTRTTRYPGGKVKTEPFTTTYGVPAGPE